MKRRRSPRPAALTRILLLLFIPIMVALGVMVFLSSPWPGLPALWLGAGAATLGFYAYDKWMAKAGGWRVPELALHALSMAGGFAGAALGMLLLRHKTRHMQFILVVALAALLHVVVWMALQK